MASINAPMEQTGAYSHDKAYEQWLRYCYMRDADHSEFIRKADQCQNYLRGNQWTEEDLAKLKQVRRPALTINKILPTMATLMGQQIKTRAEVNFQPKAGMNSDMGDVMNQVWMHIAQNNQLPWVRSEVFQAGAVTSRGFYDVRLNFERNVFGEVEILKLNSKNVLVDPDATSYDPWHWRDVIHSKWVSLVEIRGTYGDAVADDLKGRENSVWKYGGDSLTMLRDRFSEQAYDVREWDTYVAYEQRARFRVIDRQFKDITRQEFFVDMATGSMRAVPPNWSRERVAHVVQMKGWQVIKRRAPVWKWRVTIEDKVVQDSVSPYEGPTIVPFFPYFDEGHTLGLVEGLLGPQDLLNKTTSQELHVINTTANSGWKVKTGGLRNMTIDELEERGAETGLVLEVDSVDDAEKIQPNQIPQGLDRLSYKAEEYIKAISNVSDSMQGQDRADVAAKAIITKANQAGTNFTSIFDNLERSDWLLARQVLSTVQRFYTDTRTLRIVTDPTKNETQDIQINQYQAEIDEITNDLTVGEYTLTVTSVPHQATLEDAQFEQAARLKELGVQLPDEILIKNSRLQNKNDILKTMANQAQSPEAQVGQELQQRAQAATVADLEGKAAKQSADARLADAKAQQIQKEANEPPPDHALEAGLEHEREHRKIGLEDHRARQEMMLKDSRERQKNADNAAIQMAGVQQAAQAPDGDNDGQ